TAIDLSLFLRDLNGTPMLPLAEQLPDGFPQVAPPNLASLGADLELAARLRPEPARLNLLRQRSGVDLRLARNNRLPTLDFYFANSKDVGGVVPLDDKYPYELQTGLMMNVPLQRRDARGQIVAAQAQIGQFAAQERFARDTVTAEVQTALALLRGAYEQISRARSGVEVARQVEEAERKRFDEGQSTLLLVNLRESATADAALLEVDALASYFRARADYRAALGVAGLDEMTPPTE
ncbi:MAG: TolC family protein, partial [Planctomycetia bacterium]